MRRWREIPENLLAGREATKRSYRKNADFARDRMRRYRLTIDESGRKRRPYDPLKDNARLIAWKAVQRGELIPQACERCGIEPSATLADGRRGVQAHHDDYSKPLAVRWLCVVCHGVEHRVVA